MKQNFKLLLFLFITSFTFSQVVVDSPEYQTRKRNNTLEGIQVISQNSTSTTIDPNLPKYTGKGSSGQEKTNDCNCYVEPDGTYTVAMTPNDDG